MSLLGLTLMALVGLPGVLVPAASQDSAEPRRIPGTRVRLIVPPDYSPSASFTGVIDPSTGSSIMVSEVPGPYEETLRGFVDPAILRSQRMKLLKRERRRLGDHSGTLAEYEQDFRGATYHKWTWIAGTDSASVAIMATCPAELLETVGEPLRQAVLSATWDPDLVLDPLGGLAYRLGDTGSLRLFQRTRNAVTYSTDGEGDEAREGKPLFLCSPSLRPPFGDDRETFAERLLKRTASFKRVKQQSIEPILVDGLDGYLSTGTALDSESDRDSFLLQVVLFEGDSYWELKGFGAAEHRETYLPMFTRMARSFQRRWDTLTSMGDVAELRVPATWSLRKGLNDEADLQAGHSVGSVFLIVLTEPKSAFDEGFGLRAHSKLTREWLEDEARERSEPRKVEINGRRALRCEYVVPDGDVDYTYLHITVDGQQHFHQMLVWCLSANRAAIAADLERVVASFRELKGEGR